MFAFQFLRDRPGKAVAAELPGELIPGSPGTIQPVHPSLGPARPPAIPVAGAAGSISHSPSSASPPACPAQAWRAVPQSLRYGPHHAVAALAVHDEGPAEPASQWLLVLEGQQGYADCPPWTKAVGNASGHRVSSR